MFFILWIVNGFYQLYIWVATRFFGRPRPQEHQFTAEELEKLNTSSKRDIIM
jgi:hypothetical protein